MRLARPFGTALMACVVVGVFSVVGAMAGGSATGRFAQSPENTDPPEVVGVAFTRGSTVAGTFGEWKGAAPTSFAFQWQRCDAAGSSCASIAGATAELYTLVAADVGARMRVTVTAAAAGGTGQATSAASPVVGASDAPFNNGAPVVSGAARVGETLVVSSGSWAGLPTISFSYAWWRCEADGDLCKPITAATQETYTAQPEDLGQGLRAVVTATNPNGSSTAVTALTAPVTSAATPVSTSPPTIAGEPIVGRTLTASSGSWTGTLPISFAYQWRRCDTAGAACIDIGGTTTTAYVLGPSDVGRTLRVRVTATNASGIAVAVSNATGVVGGLEAPRNTAVPTISGVPRQGEFLTANRGSWTGTPTEYDYQWQRCNTSGASCGNIEGAIGRAYRLTVSDVSRRLRVRVTAKNASGSGTAFSGATSVVGPSAPVNTSPPSIAGALREGETLTASPGSWASFTPITFTYQWVRCPRTFDFEKCAPIAGAGRRTYRLVSADVGRRLFVQVKAQNSAGPTFVNSTPTGVVAPRGSTVPGATIPVTSVSLPNRLVVSRVTFTPSRITRYDQLIVLRARVTDAQTRRPVSGALVYAVGVPFDRLTQGREVATDASGWASIAFRTRATFPLRSGNFVVLFVRARKPNENVLAGVSNRRLVSIRIG